MLFSFCMSVKSSLLLFFFLVGGNGHLRSEVGFCDATPLLEHSCNISSFTTHNNGERDSFAASPSPSVLSFIRNDFPFCVQGGFRFCREHDHSHIEPLVNLLRHQLFAAAHMASLCRCSDHNNGIITLQRHQQVYMSDSGTLATNTQRWQYSLRS
ncbi:hypothetical protein TbgDal_X16460 [Trypanosoma brucei gambiense DAL972]|uniref:T. brucei spp.-specific protein n=1 Tax=Trypanosoma brucei gambiense (strain MHOM/CI/86/DAL972) TaxID=679716 RepID=C9ZZY8_TRYB9|nr:hypothetical protein TbgDal_X16460 [Trypanosoma brucei gambiense DAL972]CBH16546.1 hypothetical protein TbgDal_X16460 [Trypanosoma brucei gambiense DAL972]|eukprot:XP_011778810.1 hypothetical protein TbgDal_X16460 [Trypanosoma brucei gambiense DAL972]